MAQVNSIQKSGERVEGRMRAALYMRVSTSRQAEHDLSIPDQQSQLRSWCAANGHTVVSEFIEAGASAGNDRRPVFSR
jgi:site-specific DNA recombinase